MSETVSRRRPLEEDDEGPHEGEEMDRKKTRGITYGDITEKLTGLISTVGDKTPSIEKSLEDLVTTLYPEIPNYEQQILDSISHW